MLPHAVMETEQFCDAAWVVVAIEIAISCWAVSRRNVDPGSLGEGLRDVYERVLPLLPIDREGIAVFDLSPLVDLVRGDGLSSSLTRDLP